MLAVRVGAVAAVPAKASLQTLPARTARRRDEPAGPGIDDMVTAGVAARIASFSRGAPRAGVGGLHLRSASSRWVSLASRRASFSALWMAAKSWRDLVGRCGSSSGAPTTAASNSRFSDHAPPGIDTLALPPAGPNGTSVRSATRSIAERARGLAATSAAPGRSRAQRVQAHRPRRREGRARSTSSRLSRAMKVLTMRSSSEWKLITARRPRCQQRKCGVQALLSSSSSALTRTEELEMCALQGPGPARGS